MSPFDFIRVIMLGLLLGISLYTDIRKGRIHNKVTIPFILLGLALNGVMGGLNALLDSMGSVALVAVLFVLFAPKAGFGAGDAKLIMAVGALMGFRFMVWTTIFSGVAGGFIAIAFLMKESASLARVTGVFNNMLINAMIKAPQGPEGWGKAKIAYSPAITVGTILAYLLIF